MQMEALVERLKQRGGYTAFSQAGREKGGGGRDGGMKGSEQRKRN